MEAFAGVTRIPAALAALRPAKMPSKVPSWAVGHVSERRADDSVLTGFSLASAGSSAVCLQGFHAKVGHKLQRMRFAM